MARGRISTARMKPMGATREQRIAAMIVSGGMKNDEVWAAFEATNPEIIVADDPRRSAGLVKEPFNKDERARLGRAIRSVRGLAQKAAGEDQELLSMLSDGEARPASEVEFENIARWTSGDPDIDRIYGKTDYVWIVPPSLKEKTNPKTGKKWNYGDRIPPSMKKYLDPMTGLPSEEEINAPIADHAVFGDSTGFVQEGVPTSFVSVLGGQEGVGKSKLMINLCKSIAMMHENRPILYNYGESNLGQLRKWIGPKTPDNLIIAERMSNAQLMGEIYKWKPIFVVQDSLQKLVETKSGAGLSETLVTLKQLCTEEASGYPHIMLISQLNKAGTLKGSNDVGYLVDAVFSAKKHETRKSVFYFMSEKNRGNETGIGCQYMHTKDSVVSLGGKLGRPVFNLTQPTSSAAIAAGVPNIDPSVMQEDGGPDIA